MILAKIQNEIHNNKFLAIVKAFKTWHHYLKSYKYEVFIFIDYNNLCCFINIKNSSFRQIY